MLENQDIGVGPFLMLVVHVLMWSIIYVKPLMSVFLRLDNNILLAG